MLCILAGALVANRRFLCGLGMFGLGVFFDVITMEPSYFKVHPYSSSSAEKLHSQLLNPSLLIDFTVLSSRYQHENNLQCVRLLLPLALADMLCH